MLSVIIPTRNRGQLLSRAIASLKAQTLAPENFEVLVVDNGSTDATRSVFESLCRGPIAMRYFYDATPGLHVGRHLGLKEARGDVLVYADDDIEATGTWLEAIEECFRRRDVVLVGGNNYPGFSSQPPSWLERLWRRPAHGGRAVTSLSILELPPGQRQLNPMWVFGCNYSIRRDVLLAAGGFHPDGMPDELIRFRGDGETHVSTYIQGKGLTCLFDSRASVFHAVTPERMTVGYFRKRAFNQGVSDSYTRLRNGPPPRQSRFRGKSVADIFNAVTRRLGGLARRQAKPDNELLDLERSMAEGYSEGYDAHQAAYRDDLEVREWVHKANYF